MIHILFMKKRMKVRMRKKIGRQIRRMAKMTVGVCMATSMVVGNTGNNVMTYSGIVQEVYARDDLTYTVGNSTYTYYVISNRESELYGCVICGYEGSDTEIKIPDKIDGMNVTSIESNTFEGCSKLISVEIPTTIKSIGGDAFSGCISLTSIEIPTSVTRIYNSAFRGCSSLTSIEIPAGVTSIGNAAFSGCSSLASIEIPESVTSIDEYTFYVCDKEKLVILCYKDSEAHKYAVDNGYKYKLLTGKQKSTIKLNKSSVTLTPAKKITLTSTVSPNGTKVTWKSSKTSVATVSSTGVVTAKKAGTAVITATTSDGVKATCKVTVKNAPKSIKLNKSKVTIKKGKTYDLKYTITKNTYTALVKYSTSNKKVATVSSKGVIKAVKKGTAVITVKTDNGKVAKCKVTVK